MAVDRRLFFNVDWGFVAATVLLLGVGVATIVSASAGRGVEVKQLYAIALGVVGLLVVVSLDYRQLVDRSPALYLLTLAVLGYLLLFAPRIQNTQRWLVMPGGVQVQPSEFAKLVGALLLAKIFAESKKDSLGLADLLLPGAAVGLMALLIAAQPDLGTAITLVPLLLTVAFMAGLRMRAVLGLFLVMAVAGSMGWMFALKEYQKSRIYSFLDPSLDPRGAGYQKIQSVIAVGSGGLTGMGYGHGFQSQLGYLPARHTDFIFSVLAEENGFVGVVVVLGLYMFVLWRAFETAQMARDRAGAFLSAGVAAILSFQVIYNVAMVAGLVPVKGLPLPLMSYGGSSVLSSLLAIGLILNVRMRRFAN
jgi:rod shape determining protein RodA